MKAKMAMKFLALFILFCPELQAVTRYVSKTPGASDSNSCATSQSPGASAKATIMGSSGGISCMAQGDVLIIQAGDYNERIDSSARTIPGGTSWANATTIKGETAGTVIINGTANYAGPTNDKYIIYENLIMDNQGVYIAQGSHHFRFVNVEVRNCPDNGVQFFGGSSPGNLGGNEFLGGSSHNNGAVGAQAEHGFYIDTPNNIVDGVHIYQNCSLGINVLNSYGNNVNNTIIKNNRIHNNHHTSCVGGGQQTGFTFAGIYISDTTSGSQIYNNLVYDEDQHGIRVASPFRPATGVKVYNNTIYSNNLSGILNAEKADGTLIRNNIISSNGTKIDDPQISEKVGMIYSNNLCESAGTGCALIETATNTFTNAGALDLTLKSTSQAVGGGIQLSEVTTDFDGDPRTVPYSIGAYEFDAGGTPTISLSSPNGSESYQQGTTQSITYNFANVANVDVFLDTDNDGDSDHTIADDVAATGTVSWVVPNLPTTLAKVTVKDSVTAAQDTSENVFSITSSPGGTITKRISDNTSGSKIGDFSGTTDNHLYMNSPTTNVYNWTNLDIYKRASNDHANSLIKFDGLSQIPSTAVIQSVTLGFYLNFATTSLSKTINFHRLLRDWSEQQSTWNSYSTGNSWTTAGALGNATDRATSASDSISGITNTLGYYTITDNDGTLKSDVQNIVNLSQPNYGWMAEISGVGNDNERKLFTSSDGTNEQRPFLEVTYSTVTPTITIVEPAAGARWVAGSDQGIRYTTDSVSGQLSIEVVRANTEPPPAGMAEEMIIPSVPFDGPDIVWRVTTPACSKCLLKVTSLNDPSIFGYSAPFSIEGTLAAFTAE